MTEPRSLRSVILDDPVVANELAKYLAFVVLQDISGPFPVASDNRIENALSRASWDRVTAKINAKLQPDNRTMDHWQGGIPHVPYTPGPLVARIKDRLSEVMKQLSSGGMKATASAMNGQPTDIPSSMWDNPDAAVDLAGNLYLLEAHELKRIAAGIMIVESHYSHQPKGDRYNVDYYIEVARQLLTDGIVRSKLKAATQVVEDHEKDIQGTSREAKIEYIRRRM